MRTALAVVAAIALVAGALYVRSSFIESGQPGSTGAGVGDQAGVDPAVAQAEPVVACDARLGTACPSGSDVMDLDQLLAAFQTDPVVHEVLVAPSAVVELIEQSRTSRAAFAADRPPVALTPLVLATAASLDAVVAGACPTATWSCAADLVQAGALTPAITDPVRTSTGLAALAALTGGFFDTATYSSNVLEGSDFFTWVDAAQQQVPVVSDPLSDLILFGGARNTGAVTTEAVALDVIGRAATNVPDLLWPTPLAVLDAVVVGVVVNGGRGTDEDAVGEIGAAVGEALQASGWRSPDGAPTADGAPAVDADQRNLPSGGVLFTLRDRWR